MQLALYRKYRSRDFDELIGQDHVSGSLENALTSGRFSHAYLFTGPRGVGKTSAARILARRINKLGPDESESYLDIIEIDAASNRRIDEIRDLREKIHIAPSTGAYKVYIVDEVHMLTPEAFNALLKTLEEPPAHAVFVLATTEPHKLPETIISRTQRYNFRPIGADDLTKHLLMVAKKEGLKLDEAAARQMAVSAEGSARDGLSLLDQAANLSGKVIKESDVADMLGLIDNSAIAKLLLAVLASDPQAALEQLGDFGAHGGSSVQLIRQLLALLHQSLRCRLGASHNLEASLQSAINDVAVNRLVTIIKKLSQLPLSSPHLDIALEAALVETSQQPGSIPAVTVTEVKPAAVPVPVTAKAKKAVAAKSAVTAATAANDDSGWAKVLTRVKQQNNSLYALLRSATADISGNSATVQFRFQFHLRRIEEARNRQLLEQALTEIYNQPMTLNTVLLKGSQAEAAADEAKDSQQAVDSVLQILGGEVIGG